MTCPYSLDWPVGSGVPSLLDGRYWCMGWIDLGMSARRRRCPEDCPVNFGPWGVWRAGLASVEDAAAHAGDMGNLLRIAHAAAAVCAVGWSP